VLNNNEFHAYCLDRNFTKETIDYIASIRSSPPYRTPQSSRGNVPVWYPSQKMCRVIKAESHRIEFAFLLEYEYADTVLEYYDQARQIKLIYPSPSGRMQHVWHTPDFFVIRQSDAGYEECKPLQDLQKLAITQPNRYQLDEHGVWRCPPGEEEAAHLGLYYRVRPHDTINWAAQSNWLYLEDYYRRFEQLRITERAKTALLDLVTREPGITLAALRERAAAESITADDIYVLIIQGGIFVDLTTQRLADAQHARLYANGGLARAYELRDTGTVAAEAEAPHALVIERETIVAWDGVPWTITNVGRTEITLRGDDRQYFPLPRETFETLVHRGTIVGVGDRRVTSISAAGRARLTQASDNDLATATHRALVLRGEEPCDVTPRTKSTWQREAQEAEIAHGSGYIGLIPKHKGKSGVPKMSEAVRSLIHTVLREYYDTFTRKVKRGAYGEWLKRCSEQQLEPCSERTFYKEAARHLPAYEQELARGGPRAAYPAKPVYHEPIRTINRHGEHAWHLAHADHLWLDMEFLSSIVPGKLLGGAWLSLLFGAKTRSVLALTLSYNAPSYRSCLMLMRDCVRRHGRLPQIAMMDGGPEFRSVYFESFLARYKVTKEKRPASEPRFGSPEERLFGTAQTQFIYHLLGNTQQSQKRRQTTKRTDPKTHARWTLPAMWGTVEQWAFHKYDTIPHPALNGLSPREARAVSLAEDGARPYAHIPYDNDFIISTYPTTAKGSAKVQSGRGVQINYIYYWCDAMKRADVEGTQVKVRYDPFDITIAYAYIDKLWQRCHCGYTAQLQGCSDREMQLITKEFLRHQRLVGGKKTVEATQKQLAEFRRANERTEGILKQQLRDLELRKALEQFGGLGVTGEYNHLLTEPDRPAGTAPIATADDVSPHDDSEDDTALVPLGRYR